MAVVVVDATKTTTREAQVLEMVLLEGTMIGTMPPLPRHVGMVDHLALVMALLPLVPLLQAQADTACLLVLLVLPFPRPQWLLP